MKNKSIKILLMSECWVIVAYNYHSHSVKSKNSQGLCTIYISLNISLC